MYEISKQTYKGAKQYKLDIFPSTKPNKRLTFTGTVCTSLQWETAFTWTITCGLKKEGRHTLTLVSVYFICAIIKIQRYIQRKAG